MENYPILNSEKIGTFKNEPQNTLKELYHLHYNDLYYYGLKLSGSKDITKDCIQDLFLQFWSNSEQLSDVNSIKAYLLKCLRRRIIFSLVKEKMCYSISERNNYAEGSTESVETDIIKAELELQLEGKLRNARIELTNRQQEVIYLKYHLGYPYGMICEIMDIKYQSVRNLLSEAIKILRLKLDPGEVFN